MEDLVISSSQDKFLVKCVGFNSASVSGVLVSLGII